jgi:hypothetical protein
MLEAVGSGRVALDQAEEQERRGRPQAAVVVRVFVGQFRSRRWLHETIDEETRSADGLGDTGKIIWDDQLPAEPACRRYQKASTN